MILRTRIVLITATTLVLLFVLAVGGVFAVTGTQFGRDHVRSLVISLLRGRVHGSIYVGHITAGFLTGVSIDSLAIHDAQDSLFLSSGPVTVHYDLRDLWDQRIALRNVHLEHPVVYIRQHENGDWNYRTIFQSSPSPSAKTGHGLGDYITVDSALIRNATFILTLPWHPSPNLHGAALDSAIRFELKRTDHHIRRTYEGKGMTLARTWRWSDGNLLLLHGRVREPDSAGMLFVARDISVNEANPPFLFHNAQIILRQLGDSVWATVPHVDLPGSAGSGTAKIWWGGNLPVRYAMHIKADTVSMRDIAWIYPTLPTTGGGHSDVDIVTEPKNPRLTDFILTHLDARSTRSHLMGRMTFTTGQDTLAVKDVDMAAAPLNFDLLRTFNGKPFPYNWQGDFVGTVRASGGNLARFKVEETRFTFADANVPGAITRGSGDGEVNIYAPAFTAFHAFNVKVETLDLRTLQYLNRQFPRLNGTVSGSATLDSSWLDVRFRNGDLTHHDGPGPVSHVTGNGRVTWGDRYLTYDLDLQAQPLAFSTLRRSYPALPCRDLLSGPIRVQGQSPDLTVATSLTGAGGNVTYAGHIDADSPAYGARGSGTLTNADFQTLLGLSSVPHTAVNGTYSVDVTGDSLLNLVGTASVALAPSVIGTAHLAPSTASLRFDSGLVHVDTLSLYTARAHVDAHGSVALVNGGEPGSLSYALTVDSLAEIYQLLGRVPATPLLGSGTLIGTLKGTPSALAVAGDISARDLSYAAATVRHATGTVALADVTHTPSGVITLAADSISTATFPLDSLTAAIQVASTHDATFHAAFVQGGTRHGVTSGRVSVQRTTQGVAQNATQGTPRADSQGTAGTAQDALQDVRTEIELDTARFAVDSTNVYALTAPMHIVADSQFVSVDSALFARSGGGIIALRDARLMGDSIHGSLRTSGFTLGLLRLFSTAITDPSGDISANVDISGTTTHPHLTGAVTVTDGAATIAATRARLEHIRANIALEGDTIRVRTLSAETNREKRGTITVGGTVAINQYDNPVFALHATANNFRAVDKRGFATLDVSTSRPLTLTGPLQAAVVGGGIRVDRGLIYIPELITKRIVSLKDPELYDVIDTTVARNRALLPGSSSDFMKNLRLENVGVSIGPDVWLRSDEANINLGGALNVTLGRAGTGVGAGDNLSHLALDGELQAVRGTYRLNVIPLVQPVFDVEHGTLRFYGTSNLDPTLNITAINTVRSTDQTLERQDIRIRATIGGTLSTPTLSLSSADNLPLTQSDLLSYLITGEPAFALDYTTQQYVSQLTTAAIRSAGSVISSAIPRSVFDEVELQTPSVLSTAEGIDNPTLYNLLNTRAVFGKQLNSNLFLNFSTGFCAENFRSNLGLRLEYRFNPMYTGLIGLEPGSSDLACARTGAAPSIEQTPSQFGVDFLRAWRF